MQQRGGFGSAFIISILIVAFFVIATIGILRPSWLPVGWFKNATDWWMFLVTVLTLVLTAIIPVALYLLAKSGERTTHALLQQQRDLLGSGRLDALAKQAATMGTAEDLREILTEAESLSSGRPLARVFESYWRNPFVPLTGHVRSLDSQGAQIVAQTLEAKLRDVRTWQAMSQLERFLSSARRVGAGSVAREVADWIVTRYADGSGPYDLSVRKLLNEAGDDELFVALIDPIDNIHLNLPTDAKVHLLAGVCEAFLDRIGFYPRGQSSLNTKERDGTTLELSASMLSVVSSLLHRDRLRGMAHWPEDGLSLRPDAAAALVAAVCGAASFAERHQAERCLENIPAMMDGVSCLGLFDAELEFSRQKFRHYWPDLWKGWSY